ncbi:ABA4-like family protein [Altererythrobacter sp. KTW20L]|uniref:ABA4-like family protein n=1 Tax=Altererythrobacter sp. KTW20L TaxID=2942210 RepID=UPI0020BFB6F4|nr:ABA4-like family protein [Altererythrobacter sp. KTW20L]MCL6249539.1 ABA4-like family protein [Altererythrobacter sp. KTW20L]
MSWDFIFGAANALALASWALLVLGPRGALARTVVFYGGAGILCLAYGVLLILLLVGVLDGGSGANFTSIEGVRAIFGSDAGVTVGWIHYLAFDLFVGMWIARDADDKGFSRLWQAPVLLLTLVAGPLGLLVWLFIREPAARRANPRKGLKPGFKR